MDISDQIPIEEATTEINYCYYSSFIFIVNVVVFFYKNYYMYALFFLILFLTSISFHSNKNNITYLLDKISILMVVLYGGYTFFGKYSHIETVEQSIYASLVITSFIITIYLYYYGFQCGKYCFSENKNIANLWHSMIHVVSCIGHILIVLI